MVCITTTESTHDWATLLGGCGGLKYKIIIYIKMEYNVPYFPDYTIIIPNTYKGYERNNTGVVIKNKKGKIIKGPSWVLRNPQSHKEGYDKLYSKNKVGEMSQTIYEGDVYKIFHYLTS